MGARMPEKPRQAANYLKQMEDGDRVNARVADKVMVALPKELNEQQRVDLVRGFANDVTKGRAPWVAAIHDKGKDVGNPHAHILIRDRCPDSGKRVIGMSDAGSTDMLREKWEQHANRALEQAGHAVRTDRRSLQAQGIDRAPTIHEGPNVRAMEKRGARPTSRVRGRRNGRGARRPTRQVDYPSIDRGQSRPEYNRSLRAPESEADYWNAVDEDARRREFEERGLGADYRRAQKAGQRPASVQGVGWSPVQVQQPDELGVGPPDRRPLSVPSRLPGDAAGRSSRPAGLKPATQRIPGGQGHDEAPDKFEVGSARTAGGLESPEARNIEEHTDNLGQNTHPRKEVVVPDRNDWLRKQLQDRQNAAELQAGESRGRFDDLMKRSYLDPAGAEKAMDKYRAKHGDQALYDRLNRPIMGSPQGHGMTFGRRPGSIASTDALKPGAGDRRQDSLNPRRELADATRKMHDDRERLRAARQAVENQQPRTASQQPEPGSQTQPTAHQARRPSQPHPGQQHKGLEQAGQPNGPTPAKPGADVSRMSPEERQARQHRGLEQPQPTSRQPLQAPQPSQPHPGQQHKGLVRPGQTSGPAPARPGPDVSRMSPEARQAQQHRGLEQPRPGPAPTQGDRPVTPAGRSPARAPITPPVPPAGPAGGAAPLVRPAMPAAPGQSGGKSPTPSMAPKKRGLEM